jgi:hypothetical protein
LILHTEFFKVFPEKFARPNLHALLHLPAQARLFGSLKNISASVKEMVHRMHKKMVQHTNRRDIIRDLMRYQNDMQGIRFALEAAIEQDPNINTGLCALARLGLFNTEYFESVKGLRARGLEDPVENHLSIDFKSGVDNFYEVQCHGRPLPLIKLTTYPYLLRNNLSSSQLTDLYKAYGILGSCAVLTNNNVTFYNSVSYMVKSVSGVAGQDREDGSSTKVFKVKIKAGDVLEFVDNSADSFEGRGFGRVIAVMVHERTAFLVITWIVPTGCRHPRLHLHEFLEVPFFQFAPFQPLSIIDHQRFVNGAHFATLDSKMYLNEWIFEMV